MFTLRQYVGSFFYAIRETSEHKYRMLILEENFRRHLEAFGSELFKYIIASKIKKKLPLFKKKR